MGEQQRRKSSDREKNIFCLNFADDLVKASGLEVNEVKTKIMVFKKGGGG